MSYGRSGFQGWALSLTSFVDVSFNGPGGSSASLAWSVGMSWSSTSSERPANDPYAGKDKTVLAAKATARTARHRIIAKEMSLGSSVSCQ
jgi:hypothetical protein